MAFLAGPAALALIGGIAAPGAAFSTLGAAVGWTVGAWLFGPKANSDNQIFDPGAEEMPRINQALRGATIPVFFGTNRVSSNIVWTNRFTTIRKETTTGGGGKAGGSGGAKMGGAPAQVSYEYKWDMLFHLGLSPTPVTLYGGWLNTDKLNPDVIFAILSGSGNSAASLPAASDVDDVSLSFEDAYFGAAYDSQSEAQLPWDVFQTAEGQPARFPSTAYIGFDQLFLGSSPRVPQLTWELGPGQTQFEGQGAYISDTGPGADWEPAEATGGDHYMVLDNGQKVIPIRDNNGSLNPELYFANIDTGDVYGPLDQTQIYADLDMRGLMIPGAGLFSNGIPCVQIPGTKYFYTIQRLQDGGDFWTIGLLYAIDNDGNFEPHRGYRYVGGSTRLPGAATSIKLVGLSGEQNPALDPVMAVCTSSVNRSYLLKLPPLQVTVASNFIDDSSSPDSLEFYYVELGSEFQNYFSAGTSRGVGMNQFGCILPKAEFGLMGIQWSSSVYLFRARAEVNPFVDCDWNDAHKATYPNGYVTRIDYNINIDTGYLSLAAPEIDTTFMTDMDGDPIFFPFPDDALNRDGSTASSGRTGYVAPNVQKLPASVAPNTWLMLFPKHFHTTPSSNVTPDGNYTKVRAFLWNPFDTEATEFASNEGSFFSMLNDLGSASTPMHNGLSAYFDPLNSTVYLTAHYDASLFETIVTGTFGQITIGGQADVTPAYIVYQILTNPVFGAGVKPERIDEPSYTAAVAYCEANNIKVAVQYNREENLLGVIEQLLSLFNCFLVVSGGTIRFGLQDFSLDPVRTLDNHHFVVAQGQPPVQTIRSARQDSYNKVRVNYFDRSLSYRQNQVEVADEVDMDFNGVRMKEFPPKFVMTEALANQIAIRALWTNLYARDSYSFKIGPKDRDLEPGDPITLVDSFDANLSGGVRVRIGRIQQLEQGVWQVTAVRELDYTQTSTLAPFDASSPANRGPLSGGVAPPLDFRAYEPLRELQLSDSQVLFGYNPGAMAAGARVYVSPDGVTYGLAGDIQPFVISGMFARALVDRPTGYMEQNVEIYLSPTSGFNPNSPTFVQTYAIDDITEAGRAAGVGILIAGSEALAMENLTLLGQNHYRVGRLYRGWAGTKPQDHSSGAYWHRHGSGVLGINVTEDKIGTQFWYKVAPYNFSGLEYDVASIEAKTWTVRDAPALPQPLTDIRVFASSATAAQSIPVHSGRHRGVAAGGSPVSTIWSKTARTTGFGTGGYGAGEYGRFAEDVATPSYRVEVLSGASVVRSVLVNTEAFVYGVSENSADFGGWAGAFALRVTPVNAYGPALHGAVHSLQLF